MTYASTNFDLAVEWASKPKNDKGRLDIMYLFLTIVSIVMFIFWCYLTFYTTGNPVKLEQ